MLKNIITVAIIILTSNVFAQNNFSISFLSGVVTPSILSTRTGKYGVGYNLNLKYNISKEFSIYLGSGELIYGKDSPKIHNVSLIPIYLGSEYYISKNLISPFVSLEVTKSFGSIMPGFPKKIDGRPIGEKVYSENKKFDLFGFGISGGGGVNIETAEYLSIKIVYLMGIYSDDTNTFNSRLFIGFNYLL